MKKYRSRKAGGQILATYDALLASWGVEYEEMDIAGEYGATHVIAAGDQSAPPVVLFHGVGDDSALMWIYNAKALAARHRIYAIDTLGGPGKSVPGNGYNKRFDDTRWIDQVLDGLGLHSASLTGVSHGGYLAQLYAVKRPERVEKVVCISCSVPSRQGGSPMKTMMKVFLPEVLFPTRKNVARLLAKLSGAHANVFTDRPAILTHYQWLLKGYNNMAMAYHRVSGFSPEEVDRLRDRAFYLAGEMDPFQKLGGKRELIDCRMNVRFFPDAGHGLNHELAEPINALLLDILAGKVANIRDAERG